MARPITERILVEPSGSAVYQRAPHARSLRFPDVKTATEYITASRSTVYWILPVAAVAALLKYFDANIGVLVVFLFVGSVAVGVVATVRLHRRFLGRVQKLSWEETARLDPHAGRLPPGHPLHPVKGAAISLFLLGLGSALLVLADLERIARREGEWAAFGAVLFAFWALVGGAIVAWTVLNHLRFWWMTRSYRT